MSDVQLAKETYASDQEVKWCSGCGDYSILKQAQLAMYDLGLKTEDTVVVSGIGCSSRFPYYLDTYGYHTIHGRALAFATGVKCQNPDLNVWVAMGDGDALSIGGNHFIHAIKRNLNVVCILMDNRIYGLTKGQISPTSKKGVITKTTPYGSIDEPLEPTQLALSAGCTFIARAADTDQKRLRQLLVDAHNHKGFALIHVLQNCHIFNDKTFEDYTGKEKLEHILPLEHGEPMIFGKAKDKAIILEGVTPKVVNVADVDPEQILKHDAYSQAPYHAQMLTSLSMDEFPMPIGIIRQVERELYAEAMQEQIDNVTKNKGAGDLQKLLAGNSTWTVS